MSNIEAGFGRDTQMQLLFFLRKHCCSTRLSQHDVKCLAGHRLKPIVLFVAVSLSKKALL